MEVTLPGKKAEYSVSDLAKIKIAWPYESREIYTLILWDHDAPGGNYIHWMITDIQGDKYDNARNTILFNYVPPNPPSGEHRYTFGVFSGVMRKVQSERSNYPLNENPIYSFDIIGYKRNGLVYFHEA